MYTFMLVLHLTVCFFLIFIVLIQSSKGAEMGAAFGGSNQTLFGSRGAATFLNKITTVVAVAFMLTSLSLAFLAVRQGSIMPETAPVRESPVTPFNESTTGPIQEQPAAQADERDHETPIKPVE